MTEYVYITDIVKVKSRVPYCDLEELESSEWSLSQTMKHPMGPMEMSIVERITPEEFVDESGRHYFLGLSRKVQEELRLPFDAFENMKKELEKKRRERTKLFKERNAFENALEKYDNMKFWQRFKFLLGCN